MSPAYSGIVNRDKYITQQVCHVLTNGHPKEVQLCFMGF